MRIRKYFTALIALCALSAQAYDASGLIDVEVVDQYGQSFRTFPTGEGYNRGEQRAYLEARPGAPYSIQVTNRSPNRVGLVIAVDGRNIISGKKSRLRRSEKMYVLRPWQTATYSGWRTGRDRINEFFFTSDLDAYAGAFGDFSAMGVVAVAAFEDRDARPPAYRQEAPVYGHDKRRSDSASKHGGPASQEAAPGTGFGDERYAPSYRVNFNPKRRAATRTYIKYEWRETLCRMGITRCGTRANRFWPSVHQQRRNIDRGFAAYPPGYRYRGRETSVKSRRYR